MRQKLFTVEDRFDIAQRGLAIVGARPTEILSFNLKDETVLVHPDSSEINADIEGTDIFQTVSGVKKIAFLIKLSKREVPIGTEVFLKP